MVTDGTRADGSRPSISTAPSSGNSPAAEANAFLLCPFDHHAVLRDQRTYLFIIYVFSRYKRLMVPIRYSSI